MRYLLGAILFLFLICIPATLHAQTVDVNVKDDYVRPYVVPPKNVQTAGRFEFVTHPLIHRKIYAPQTCYTLHTLYAEKADGSDETKIVGQQTCTPASQFEVKHTVQKAK